MNPATEIAVRVASYAVVFAAMAAWEWLAPRRKLLVGRRARWANNLGILIVDIVAVRLLVPTAAVGVALIAAQHDWGLLRLLGLPLWAAGILGFILLDFTIYLQHRLFHAVPLLWRLHRMHHADLDIDVTTGVRFHPAEIVLSALIKIAAVLALGVPALSVLLFEVVLNATSMFNHSNVKLPPRLEALARLVVVTPQMHEVHHSVLREETDSNFGFNLPWWDRLFGTYRAQPAVGPDVQIGLPEFRDPGELRLDRLLTQPFRNGTSQKDGGDDGAVNGGRRISRSK
ncbi:MAG TPA: sterol desaturase family protein [Pseudolabrys sp.]|jgi:sterol desaturase/sphingolipid hydroxylase (fatty acid hydroxylase superfamily)|nr:sterol desaturase family protein [Pseudolabrys sp.]